MKVVLLSGSTRSNSRTNVVRNQIRESLKKKFGDNIHIQCFDQTNLNAGLCLGCNTCFFTGKCVLDQKKGDHIEDLKKALKEADLIYLLSPVYFHQVSGAMKTFIDRLSYWTHLISLTGKVGVTVSVSSNNGNEFVNCYLEKFADNLGLLTISNLSLLMDQDTSEEKDKKIEQSTNEVYDFFAGNRKVPVSQNQSIKFLVYKQKYEDLGVGAEYQYWQNNSYFEYSDFSDLWLSKHNKVKV